MSGERGTSSVFSRRRWRKELLRELGGEANASRSQKMLVRNAVNQMSFLADIDNQLLRLPSVVNSGRVRGLLNDRIRASAELRDTLRHLGLAKRKGAPKTKPAKDSTPDLAELLAGSTNSAKRSGAARRTQPEPTVDSPEPENSAARAESAAGNDIPAPMPMMDAQVLNRAHGLSSDADELETVRSPDSSADADELNADLDAAEAGARADAEADALADRPGRYLNGERWDE